MKKAKEREEDRQLDLIIYKLGVKKEDKSAERMASVIFCPNHTKQNTSVAVNEDFSFDLTKLPFRALYFYCNDVISAFYIPLLVFGVTANILNITVFVKTGVRDNVTVSFLALSVSDLTYLVVISPFFTAVTIIHYVEQRQGKKFNWLIDKNIISFPFYWYSFVFYETSILITVYISVVRCACVAMPFTVKNIFTSRRAIVTFITFFISLLLLRIPVFMTKRIVREFDPILNTTQVVYRELDDGGLSEKLHDIMNRNILNWASIVIVIACLVVMVTKLRASVRFRSSAGGSHSAPTHTAKIIDTSGVDLNNTTTIASNHDKAQPLEHNGSNVRGSLRSDNAAANHKVDRQQATGNQTSKPINSFKTNQTTLLKGRKLASSQKEKQQVLSSKEAQVVRAVILVAAVFVTCQTPLMAYTLARTFESQFDGNDQVDEKFITVPKYLFLFALISNIGSFFTLINASVNIIIHYNFNSRYRQTMKALWKSK